MKPKTIAALVTLFGLGGTVPAPGTAASVVALPWAWLFVTLGGGGWSGRGILLLAGLMVFAAGAYWSDIYARESGCPDPSECVIDEVAGQWIVCAFTPQTWLGYVLAFVLFRVFDILKPWPIAHAERVPGGLGIMLDDVVAGLMASAVIAIAAHAGLL